MYSIELTIKLSPLPLIVQRKEHRDAQRLYAEVIELDFKLPCIIHSSAILDASASKGQGNVIGPNVIIGAEVKIGSNKFSHSLSSLVIFVSCNS